MQLNEESEEYRQQSLPIKSTVVEPTFASPSSKVKPKAVPVSVSAWQIGVWISYLNRTENGFLKLVSVVPILFMVIFGIVALAKPETMLPLLGMEIFFGAMVAGLLVPRAINKNKSRAALLDTLTRCEKEHLETVCYIGTAHDKIVRKSAGARLLDLLPEIRECDNLTLGRYSRAGLHRILKSKEPSEVRLALQVVERIGEKPEIATVEALAAGKHLAEFSTDLRQKALSLLPMLRERAENVKLGTTLLRASSFSEGDKTLLRPTSPSADTDPKTLLRVGEVPPTE